MNDDQLGDFEDVDVREIWPNEQQDFTPWLASEKNIARLGAAIGLDLEVENTEVAVGPYSADILAKDTVKDTYVVIENQFGKTNHDHLGKLITYASVLDARAVVWIASEFTDEHRKAMEWLNDNSAGLSFYAVSIEVQRIGQSKPAVRFNVLSHPADVDRHEATGSDRELTQDKQMAFEFWGMVRERLVATRSIPSLRPVKPYNFYDVTLGKSGLFLSNMVNIAAGRMGVRLYVSNKIAQAAIPQLLAEKDQIEKEVGQPLNWDANPSGKDKQIALVRDVDFDDKTKWEGYADWMADTILKFRKAFAPRIRQMEL